VEVLHPVYHGSMVIAQLTLVGLLLLKQSFYAGPSMGPLITITSLFIFFVNREFTQVISHLPAQNCVIYDSLCNEDNDSALDFLRGAYLQPALKDQQVEPEYEVNARSSLHHEFV